MNTPVRSAIRKKAVWGLKPALAAFNGMTLTLAGASASAEAHHRQKGERVRPGRPNKFVRDYRLDNELTRRAKDNTSHVSSVIVELRPGAQVPAQFQRFVRGNKLDIINGVVLEVP